MTNLRSSPILERSVLGALSLTSRGLLCALVAGGALASPLAASAGAPGEASRELYRCGTAKWSWLSVVRLERDWGSGSLETAYVLQHVSDAKMAMSFPSFLERLFEGASLDVSPAGSSFSYKGRAQDGMRAGVVTLSLRKLPRVYNEGVNHGVNSGDVEATLTGSGEAFGLVSTRLAALWAPVVDSFTYPDGAPSATRFYCMASVR